MRSTLKNIGTVSALCMMTIGWVHAQDTLRFAEAVAVKGRPFPDSITLRWAPLKFAVWQEGNKNGYIIERYTMARNGTVLTQPEKAMLTSSPLKPWPVDQWQTLVPKDKYAAIAAQALYGDRFEIDLGKSDVFTIVNKVRENEQRFAFALFSADISPAAAKASGLWFTDKQVKKGEKYLYRIIIHHPMDSLKGSIFIGTDDMYNLPRPLHLTAEFKDHTVSLRWEKGRTNKYTAYVVERSEDGKNFAPLSDTPLVTLSPADREESRYEYAADSIADLSKTYSYRVRGVTPFGELSDPSETASGKGSVTVADVPYIKEGENIDNTSIRITWEFPQEYDSAIKGFSIERSSRPQGNYTSLTLQAPLPPATRTYQDKAPRQVNYYRVTAQGLNGEQYRSPVYLAQLVDSIPPVAPSGLKASVDEYGTVALSWAQNKESDMYGYRIYRGNNEKEELSQITSEPIARSSYTDKVNINTLNEAIYYSVMAIDRNQNHSGLSELLKVDLPDKVKPMAPVFLPLKSGEKGVALSWIKSSSTDVIHYDVYRRAPGKREWQRIKVVPATSDTTCQYADEATDAGSINAYTVVAVDDAGLESEPAMPVSGGKIDSGLRAPVQWKEPVINKDQKQVLLGWRYDQQGVKSFRIYKALDENLPVMFRTVPGDKREVTDTLIPGKRYTYKVMAIFENDNKSTLSEEVIIRF